MFLLTFKYRPEHVDCQYCTEVGACRHRAGGPCPWLAERLEAGVVSYSEVMLSLLDDLGCPLSCRRMTELLDSWPGTLWHSESHQVNYHWLESNIPLGRADTTRRLASAYLLSSTPELIRFSKSCCVSGIHGQKLNASTDSLSDAELTMLIAAFNLLSQPEPPALRALLSPNHADLFSTRQVAHALLIARYGSDVLKIAD